MQFLNENWDFIKLVSATISLTASHYIQTLRYLSGDIEECHFCIYYIEKCQPLKEPH